MVEALLRLARDQPPTLVVLSGDITQRARRKQFRAARDEWQRADPAQGDARTQFYIAYSFYREGWGRVYYDQDLFKQGLEAANRAATVELTIDDPNLKMHTVAELKAELEQGVERSWSDVNPLKVLRTRK